MSTATRHISTITNLLWRRVKNIFSLDLRALAVLRIGLAILIIIDLTMGAMDFQAFFTNTGFLPTDILLTYFSQENIRAFHSLSGSYRWQLILLITNYGIAFLLLIGRKTRRMHILAWLFFCSLSARNPIINSGADSVMRVLLFWSMFLPTHLWRSIDTKHNPKPQETQFLGRGTVGLVIQIFSIYIWNYLLKTDAQRQSTFTATYTAFSIDMFRTALGTWVYQFPTLMTHITHLRILLEGRGALLFLIPWKHAYWKFFGVSAYVFAHFGMALTLKIGYFPRACILARISLYPAFIWDIMTHHPTPRHQRWKRKPHYGRSLFLIICILYISAWNLRTTNFDKRDDYFPTTMNKYGFLVRLDQYRSMFTPYPLEDDGRFVVKGRTDTGDAVNLLVPTQPVTYEKPTNTDLLYPGEKRRKLFLNFWSKDYAQYRAPYLQRQCRTRNQKHPSNPITSASMEYVVERTKPNYQVLTGEIVMLAQVECE